MKKAKEAIRIEKNGSESYVAIIYDIYEQTYEDRWFFRYTKKEIYALLRADNISIPKGV